MAGYFSMKMKRKELEEVNDEFSDFSLSSPARKIRRLDAELPPILEEEEPKFPSAFRQQVVPEPNLACYMEQGGSSSPVIEELPLVSNSEERAIVLFKPIHTPLLRSPSNLSVTVNSDVMSGIKNHFFWSNRSKAAESAEDESKTQSSDNRATNGCLAVVPWIPAQIPLTVESDIPRAEVTELMESEDMGEAAMDIEENNVFAEPGKGSEFSGMSEGLHQWQQQQHCMIPPQLPQNASTPVVGFDNNLGIV